MRKEYHIPTIEVVVLIGSSPMMAIEGSKDYWHAPERVAPVPQGGVKAF